MRLKALALGLALVIPSMAFAQDGKFGDTGVIAPMGSISFTSEKWAAPDDMGGSDADMTNTYIKLMPVGMYFVTDGIGVGADLRVDMRQGARSKVPATRCSSKLTLRCWSTWATSSSVVVLFSTWTSRRSTRPKVATRSTRTSA